VAALGVFAFHSQSLLLQWPVLAPLVAGGQSGVSFFFVLSGFVLTWSAGAERPAVRAFWRRRAARVLPGYWVTWLIGIPVTWLAFGAWPSPAALFGTATLTQSWFDDKSIYFGVNGVGWSLSCEVLFYALFPALLLVLRRTSRRGVVGVAGGCVAVLLGLDGLGLLVAGAVAGDPAGSTFWRVSILPASRLPEFVLGMAGARALSIGAIPRLPVRSIALAAAAAVYAAGLGPAAAVAGGITGLPFALVICAAAQAELGGRAGPLAGRRWVQPGSWSYAFYLTHQLVLRVEEWRWGATGVLWLHVLLGLIAAMAVSAVLYRFVEQPIERGWRPRRPAHDGATD
jgi:peptidoglycan/LPS O-acetylase OafA/YrhL